MADLIANLQAAAGAAGGGGWDISTAVYDSGNAAWDLSKAKYGGGGAQSTTLTQETTPQGLFFKSDGTKMYVCGASSTDINEYNLTSPWAIANITFVQGFDVATQDNSPSGLFFKPDGTKVYFVGRQNDKVYEYNLSTAWDISTASYVQDFSVSTEETEPRGLFFKPDGTKMYVVGVTGDDVNEYSLSTAWNISTASYTQNFSVAAQETNPFGISFKPDGTKMYINGSSGDDVNEYSLSTPWDVSTASYVQVFAAPQETSPTCLFFHPDGIAFYILGTTNDAVFQYVIGGFDLASQETAPTGISFKNDGTKMYIIGTSGDDVNEYNLSTAWDVTTASYVQVFSVLAQGGTPHSLFFKPDGTKMYVLEDSTDRVNEYTLSTAWDVSTASFVQFFSVGGEEVTVTGLFFGDDGVKMYVIGRTGDDVNEYTLSTAWNVSTASYVQNFSIAAKDTNPYGLFFKSDGTKMYIIGGSFYTVLEYDLSTAWNVSTATFSQQVYINPPLNNPQDLFFSDDGTKMFLVDSGSDRVFRFNLS